MERLPHKIILTASMLMISFALLVSLQAEHRSNIHEKAELDPDSADTPLTGRIRPKQQRNFRNIAVQSRPSKKRFHANSLTTDQQSQLLNVEQGTTNTVASSIQEFDLDDLPNLDLPNLDFLNPDPHESHPSIQPAFTEPQSPRKIMNPFSASSEDAKSTNSDQLTNQNVSTEKASARSQIRQVQIAPAVVSSYLEKLRYAKSLARRGAISTAFEELKGSLKLVAEAIDQLQQTQEHSAAVHSAFVALKEVSDLATWRNDLSIFVAGHETTVLKNRDLDKVSFHEARLAYLGFIEKQLRKGCEDLPMAAETFRSLGKVYLMQEDFLKQPKMTQAKAMLMFRIATSVNPNDAVAARELGILYAKYNHYDEAKQLLVKSLQVRNDSTTWQNLSKIHRFLGESGLAMQAATESRLAANQQQKANTVLWTNPANFNRVQSMIDPPVMTARANPSQSAQVGTAQRNAAAQRSFNQRNNRR